MVSKLSRKLKLTKDKERAGLLDRRIATGEKALRNIMII
jgi:hypothetical protein